MAVSLLRKASTFLRCSLVVFLMSGVTSFVFAQSGLDNLDVPLLELDVKGYQVEGFNPLSNGKTAKLLAPYTGTFDSLERIYDAAIALEAAMQAEGYSLMSVVVPQQPVTNAIIILKTEGFTVSTVEVRGNKFFSEKNIRLSVPRLIEGGNPNLDKLQKSLSVSNLHPAKRVTVNLLSKDKNDQTVGVVLNVNDKAPRQYFSWLNDTGNERTGEYRLGIGYQNSNLFDRDHAATLTYTTSPDNVSNVSQLGVHYRIPLYEPGGLLDILAFSSDIDTGTVAEVFEVSGRGETYRLGYTQLLPKSGNYTHQLSIAIEDKLFDNEVTFDGVGVVPDVRSRPVNIGYQGTKTAAGAVKINHSLTALFNVAGGSLNSDEDYQASRAGASADWNALRLSGSITVPVNNWRMIGQIKAQTSSEPLITGEQFGIGGLNSVRGFREREVTGDKGIFVSLQLWAPPIKNFNLLGFLEGGNVQREQVLEGEPDSETISSVGFGMQWISPKSAWSLKLDAAHVLDGASTGGSASTRDGDNRIHFNLLFRK